MAEVDEYPLVTAEGKRYRVEIGPEGQELRHYETGTVYDMTAKAIYKGNITQETATIMQREGVESRYEKAQEMARRGMLAGIANHEIAQSIKDERGLSSDTAWAAIAAAQTELALDTDKGHASTKAAEFVGKAAGYLDKPQITVDGKGNVSGTTTDPALAAAILAYAERGGE